jgi:DNA-binding IclR family transcriptional regulator
MTTNEPRDTRKTTERSLQTLEAVGELEGATLSELAEYMNLAVSTLHTHIRTLENAGYVAEVDGEYQLGLKLFHLGEKARTRDNRYRHARHVAADLAQRTIGEVNFAVESDGRAIIVFAETNGPFQEEFQAGWYLYMHSSASGKAMLAEHPEERVYEIVDEWGLPKHTRNTITDTDELLAELETIRQQGYAVNDEEHTNGVRAIAMPVRDTDGSVFGTLDISGPSYRLPDSVQLADLLRPYVRELEDTIDC